MFSNSLILCIAVLFNAIIDIGKIPTEWKQGLIIPIYQGAGKPKDSCKSYRPVALLPCIFKIFEKIIISRINSQILQHSKFPNPQQQGFQKNLGCLTASFDLQETVFHNLEQNNNVYVSFLDTSNAFDTVWRNGLLFKLFNLGITGKTWSLIQNCHSNTVSSVVVNQTRSKWFSVHQGVRQGGVLSTFLIWYLSMI